MALAKYAEELQETMWEHEDEMRKEEEWRAAGREQPGFWYTQRF